MTYYRSFLFPVGLLSLESISCIYTKKIKVSSQHEVDEVSPGHLVSRWLFPVLFRDIVSRVNHKELRNFSRIIRLHFSSAGCSRRSVLRWIKMMDRKENFRTLFIQMFEEEDDGDEGHRRYFRLESSFTLQDSSWFLRKGWRNLSIFVIFKKIFYVNLSCQVIDKCILWETRKMNYNKNIPCEWRRGSRMKNGEKNKDRRRIEGCLRLTCVSTMFTVRLWVK